MEIPVFDCHADTPFVLWQTGQPLEDNTAQVSLRRAQTLGSYAQVFAYCTYPPKGLLGATPEQLYALPKASFDRQCERLSGRVQRCFTAADVAQAWRENRLAALFSLEGPEGIGCDAGRLEDLKRDGVRMTTLTWNADNALAGFHESHRGLSADGREFVRRAQGLGMVVDVSHCADRTLFDVLEAADAPVIASHSNSRSLCRHSRNLTDEMFCALCDTGGLAGINLYARFLREEGGATLEDVYAHIDHFLSLRGDDHVALGGDLDGCDALPEGFGGVDGYCALSELLLRHYSTKTVEKIFYRNILRVLEKCER